MAGNDGLGRRELRRAQVLRRHAHRRPALTGRARERHFARVVVLGAHVKASHASGNRVGDGNLAAALEIAANEGC